MDLFGAKTSTAGSTAARARTEGRSVLMYRQNIGATSTGMSGPVTDAAEVIEAIEREGWRLDLVSYDGHQSKNGAMILLFRRAAIA